MQKYKEYLGLGIAGNFALHLAQAGELEEFKEIITADEAAPKGIFPFYLPAKKAEVPAGQRPKETLFTYPLSSNTIRLPKEQVNVQAEPEVGLVCELTYEGSHLASLTPTHFAPYNDCSIRVAGAEKISDKKNWGEESKGFGEKLIPVESFREGGEMDHYSICSFLKRENRLHAYGEDVALTGYSYFYGKLQEWITNQINTQKDFGPLEPILEYIELANRPTKLIISIGATRYTPYGESTFLQEGDEVIVALYDNRLHTVEQLKESLLQGEYEQNGLSVLAQKVTI